MSLFPTFKLSSAVSPEFFEAELSKHVNSGVFGKLLFWPWFLFRSYNTIFFGQVENRHFLIYRNTYWSHRGSVGIYGDIIQGNEGTQISCVVRPSYTFYILFAFLSLWFAFTMLPIMTFDSQPVETGAIVGIVYLLIVNYLLVMFIIEAKRAKESLLKIVRSIESLGSPTVAD